MVDVIRHLVRPFIAVAFVVMVGWLVYGGGIDPKDILGMLGLIIGFYFGERAALKKPGQ